MACGAAFLEFGPHVRERFQCLMFVAGADGDDLRALHRAHLPDLGPAEAQGRLVGQTEEAVVLHATDGLPEAALQLLHYDDILLHTSSAP